MEGIKGGDKMNYGLYSGVIIVRIGKQKDFFKQKKYSWVMNRKELYHFKFDDEDRNAGFVSHIKNIHMYDEFFLVESRYNIDREMALEREAVQFLVKDDCIVFFCSNISYVVKWREFFETVLETSFEILKHPFNQEVEQNRNRIVYIMNRLLEGEEVCHFELDKTMGLTLGCSVEGKTRILKYYTNGLLHFGMMNDEKVVKKMIDFAIDFDKQYKKIIA